MHIDVSATAGWPEIVVVDADNLRALDARLGALTRMDLSAALDGIGSVDGDHVWIEIAALRAAASRTAMLPDWDTQFDAMIAYAERSGWTTGSRVRAHLD